MNKSEIRKKILKIRQLNSSKSLKINFEYILKILKKNKIDYKLVGGYYPYNNEIDAIQILEKFEKKKYQISLPKIKKNFQMNFFPWSNNEPLEINKLNENHLKLKNEIDINQKNYEKLIDEAADEISSFVEKANLENLS